MKFATILKSLALMSAVLMSSGAFAAGNGSLQLSHAITANGVKIQAGSYKVEWEGTGPDVEVSVTQGKKVVAKLPAHLVDLDKPADRSAAITQTNDDGTSSLAGIRFAGKKVALELGESASGMAGSSK